MLATLLLIAQSFFTISIPAGAVLVIGFESNNTPDVNYRLWCDGSIVKNYSAAEIQLGKSLTADADGYYTYRVSAPGLSAGPHSCQVSSYVTDGNYQNEPRTEPMLVTLPVQVTVAIPK